MRIAIFWSEILHYHAARIAALCRGAEREGHTVHPFVLRSGSPNLPVTGYHDLLGTKIAVLSNDPARSGPFSALSRHHIIEFLSDRAPDVVAIPGYADPAALAALRWCRHNHRGVVLMSESQARDYVRSPARERLKRSLLSCFDAALVGGSPHVDYVLALGMPADRVFTGYDVVDNDFWASQAATVRSDPGRWRRVLGVPENFFLTASRLVPKKNVAGLIHAYARYVRETNGSAWPLLIAGDGPLKAQLEQLVTDFELTSHVHFMGYLSADDMAPLYALASVFILASGYSEQWGLVVNEAMAAGTPVLVSQVCGCAADLVVRGETGFTFDPGDEDALAALLGRCTSGHFDRARMGLAAQIQVAQFSPDVFADHLLSAAYVALEHARTRRGGWGCRVVLSATQLLLRSQLPQPQ